MKRFKKRKYVRLGPHTGISVVVNSENQLQSVIGGLVKLGVRWRSGRLIKQEDKHINIKTTRKVFFNTASFQKATRTVYPREMSTHVTTELVQNNVRTFLRLVRTHLDKFS